MTWLNTARAGRLGSAALALAGLALLSSSASAQDYERVLGGIALNARSSSVLAKYGNPNEVVIGEVGVRGAPAGQGGAGGGGGFDGAPGGFGGGSGGFGSGRPGGFGGGAPGSFSGGAPGGFSGGAPGGFGGAPGGFGGPSGYSGAPGGMSGSGGFGRAGGGAPGSFSGGAPGGFSGGAPGSFSGGAPGGFSSGAPGGFGGAPGGFGGGGQGFGRGSRGGDDDTSGSLPGSGGFPGGPGGFPGSGGGGTSIGQFGQTISTLARQQEVTWIYNRKVNNNLVSYEFLIGPAGAVSQIRVSGYYGGNSRTKRGIALGSTYKEVVQKYGFPEEHYQVGRVLVASYRGKAHVQFQFMMDRPQSNPMSTGNKVVAITIATVE